MYWLLNFLPLIIDFLSPLFSLFNGYAEYNQNATAILFLWVLILVPFYLLYVNIIYISRHKITYTKSAICMAIVIFMRVILMLLSHKIKYNTFIGDVPEGIYYIMIICPLIIIAIGLVITYFMRR